MMRGSRLIVQSSIGKNLFAPRRASNAFRLCSRSFSSGSPSPSDSDLWAWIPPRDKANQHVAKQTYQLEVKIGELPTPEELSEYLKSNGAQNVVVIDLKEPLVNITHLVIASASSTRLIRQMAETISENLKQRELLHVQGSAGVEGERNDEWQLVDCHHALVHLMLPETRRAIDLESHWTMEQRPVVPYYKNERDYDDHFDRLLQKYPVPQEYNITIGAEESSKESAPQQPIKVL